jgi:hypothetical protein
MNLRAETQEILERVEEISGKPVEILEDATQPHLARITRARGNDARHLLRVNPSMGEPDYLIAYECGFILRLFKTPSEDRREFAGTAHGRSEVERMVRQAGQLAHLPDTARRQLAQQFLDGILTQLRSYPIGMRIDERIKETFPGLLQLQLDGIRRQQSDNLQALRPEIRALSPKAVYDANVSMNAAYAIFCDREFEKAGFAIPFRSAGYEKRGRTLLSLLASIPPDPASDRMLVDSWADELGLSGWYQWIPLQP